MESDILVVDDSAAIRKILQRVLRQTGMAIHAIHEAGDGQEALALLAQHPVHLVLTDINMPRMNGEEFLRCMEQNELFRTIPVIVVSTDSSHSRVQQTSVAGLAAVDALLLRAVLLHRRELTDCYLGDRDGRAFRGGLHLRIGSQLVGDVLILLLPVVEVRGIHEFVVPLSFHAGVRHDEKQEEAPE